MTHWEKYIEIKKTLGGILFIDDILDKIQPHVSLKTFDKLTKLARNEWRIDYPKKSIRGKEVNQGILFIELVYKIVKNERKFDDFCCDL